MLQFHRTSKQSLARVFALVALLCAGALQVQEANHDHWHIDDDGYAQCLLHKSSSAVLPGASPTLDTPAAESVLYAEIEVSDKPEPVIAFFARGPPLLS